MRSALRGPIAALTAAALLALCAIQPFHGAAAGAAIGIAHTATSITTDAGAATPDAHHAHLCPLCRAANQARVALVATPQLAVAALSFRSFSIHAAPAGLARSIELCTSGPRAPPRSLAPLV